MAQNPLLAFDPTQVTHPANRSTARGDSTGRPPHIAYQCQGTNVGPMGTLRAGNGHLTGGVPFMPVAYGVALRGREEGLAAELSAVAPALRSASGGASKGFVAYSIVPEGQQGADLRASEVDVAPALTRTAEARSTDRGLRVVEGWRVRRLTPRECERLQGFPDDWTAIPGAKDGPRYAALGNSMAVPVIRWLGERIQKVDALLAE